MVILYLVAASILVCLGSAQDVPDQAYKRGEYPNPMSHEFSDCGRKEMSYICDPHSIISESEADQLNKQLVHIVSELRCPCSRFSCRHHKKGHVIGIALTNAIDPEKRLEESAEQLSENEYEKKRNEWLLHEAEKFAHHLLNDWKLGHCKEDVIVLYSRHDGVLYTVAGDVAKMKLNNSVIQDVSRHAQHQFGHDGSVFKGLLKMVKDYRTVFQDNYEMGKPITKQLRNYAVSVTKHGGSLTTAVMPLLSIFSVMLCRSPVAGTH